MDHSNLNPAILKPGLTTAAGANLKPGLVTSSYVSGIPSASDQIKPSLRNSDGTLKAGLLDGNALKASLSNGGPPPNYYAQFNGTSDEAAIPAVTLSAAAGTMMIRCKLNAAIPATAATSGLFAFSSAGFGSHYPINGSGQIYETCFRTTRVGPFAPSGSITRTNWHWVIIRDDAANGWEFLQASDDGTLYSLATAAHEAFSTTPTDRLIAKQKNGYRLAGAKDVMLLVDSRLSGAQCQAFITARTVPSGALLRFEFSSNAGGVFTDESGNGKHATISGSPAITAF